MIISVFSGLRFGSKILQNIARIAFSHVIVSQITRSDSLHDFIFVSIFVQRWTSHEDWDYTVHTILRPLIDIQIFSMKAQCKLGIVTAPTLEPPSLRSSANAVDARLFPNYINCKYFLSAARWFPIILTTDCQTQRVLFIGAGNTCNALRFNRQNGWDHQQ